MKPYNIFGSEDSVDVDVMFYIDELPSIKECKEICKEFDQGLQKELKTDKEVNTNLCVLEDGVISEVFKGFPQECNNSIFYTYNFHDQPHPLMIKDLIWDESNIPLKCARCLRILLSFISRTEHREIVKKSLRGSTTEKIKTLTYITLEDIEDFGKNNQTREDIFKSFSFQIGQTIALLDNIELFTKRQISDYLPDLTLYLMRKKPKKKILDHYKQILIEKILEKFNNPDNQIKER